MRFYLFDYFYKKLMLLLIVFRNLIFYRSFTILYFLFRDLFGARPCASAPAPLSEVLLYSSDGVKKRIANT